MANTRAGKRAGTRVKRGKAAAPRKVVVIGAGRMGADIALAFAMGGWRCEVVEPDAAVRRRAQAYWPKELARLRSRPSLRRLGLHEGLAAAPWKDADLVVESVTENLATKHRLLREVEALAPRRALIVTNTSSLRIADVTRPLRHAERSAGLHFMLPSHVMLAVEVTKGPKTSAATMRRLLGWMHELGKVPIVLSRDVPGMLINRIQHAMFREIYHLIDTGIVRPEDVDRAVRFGFGFRYQYAGPVVSRDIHGLPVHLATASTIVPTLYNGKAPGKLLRKLVADGHHGVRTGRGFYKWDTRSVGKRLDHYNELMEGALRRVKRRGEPTEF